MWPIQPRHLYNLVTLGGAERPRESRGSHTRALTNQANRGRERTARKRCRGTLVREVRRYVVLCVLLNDIIGSRQQGLRNRKAKRFRRFEINDHFNLGRLLHW